MSYELFLKGPILLKLIKNCQNYGLGIPRSVYNFEGRNHFVLAVLPFRYVVPISNMGRQITPPIYVGFVSPRKSCDYAPVVQYKLEIQI